MGFGAPSLLQMAQAIEAAVLGKDRVRLLLRPIQDVTGQNLRTATEEGRDGATVRLSVLLVCSAKQLGEESVEVGFCLDKSRVDNPVEEGRASTAASGGAS